MQTATNVFSGVYDVVGDNFSTIEQTATSVNIAVSSAKSSLWSAINVTSTQISLKVGKGELISSINLSPEEITISSSKVNLEGYVQASDITTTFLKAKIADIDSVILNAVVVTGGLSAGGDLRTTGTVGGSDVVVGGTSLKNAIVSASVSNNTLTLTDVNGNTTNFSKATTLSGGWSSGKFTVTASPQGQSISTTLTADRDSATQSNGTVSIPMKATVSGGSGQVSVMTATMSLSSHTGCVQGLSRYNSNSTVTLYQLVDGAFQVAGTHYWYWTNTNRALTTYYS